MRTKMNFVENKFVFTSFIVKKEEYLYIYICNEPPFWGIEDISDDLTFCRIYNKFHKT